MNRLFAALYLLLALTGSGGRGGLVFGFSPSPVKSVHTQASSRPMAFTSFKAPIKKTSPQSPVLLKFTPKDDSEVSDDTPFIRPALHNSNFFRAISILYAVLFAVYTSSKSPAATTNALNKLGKYLVLSSRAAATVHMLSFGTWFGTVFYTTFVAGITMFKNLPRRTFGSLQSKLFPLYFKLCTGTLALQILTLTAMPDVLSKTSEVSLLIAFFATLLNLLYLEPTSTRVMFDRYKLEDDGKRDSDEYKTLAKSFGKFHGISSLTNLIAFCGGIVHAVRLASNLAV